jgi:hypothetical protein
MTRRDYLWLAPNNVRAMPFRPALLPYRVEPVSRLNRFAASIAIAFPSSRRLTLGKLSPSPDTGARKSGIFTIAATVAFWIMLFGLAVVL